jgi:hypothetical protein
MKALTFLGAGRYETVTYVWEERSHTTRLFPEALARIFEPEKVIVFVTERAKTYPCLRVGTNVCGNAAGQTRPSGGMGGYPRRSFRTRAVGDLRPCSLRGG